MGKWRFWPDSPGSMGPPRRESVVEVHVGQRVEEVGEATRVLGAAAAVAVAVAAIMIMIMIIMAAAAAVVVVVVVVVAVVVAPVVTSAEQPAVVVS